jgi:hypothetical protein
LPLLTPLDLLPRWAARGAEASIRLRFDEELLGARLDASALGISVPTPRLVNAHDTMTNPSLLVLDGDALRAISARTRVWGYAVSDYLEA